MIFSGTIKKGCILTLPRPIVRQLGLKVGSKFSIQQAGSGFQLIPLSHKEIKELKRAKRRRINKGAVAKRTEFVKHQPLVDF
ncbi:hypothetical protein REC12_13295 [Desulfosporosinus sp. PR]|uniref:hypothetical protein n=1 Tax=Candidatus Desulfosporosinus nitrosoreducens TaxID=3401928 RepID=UPI0027EFF694|nr:hypothetical protein [Desulfosporosinus sp. PR]MDQ7094566.1 hypothetical protein [Desulfosporosinus sp. PR]